MASCRLSVLGVASGSRTPECLVALDRAGSVRWPVCSCMETHAKPGPPAVYVRSAWVAEKLFKSAQGTTNAPRKEDACLGGFL